MRGGGSIMSDDEQCENMMEAIRLTFPEVRSTMDARWDAFMHSHRLEDFAALTTRELGKPDPSRGVAYLKFMSSKLRTATVAQRKLIDVSFAEVLFFEAPRKTIVQGWPLVPENIKQLYLAMWGKPPSGK